MIQMTIGPNSAGTYQSGEPCRGECLKGLKAGDLTLGKPSLFPLSTSATVAQAIKALKFYKDVDALSVWVDNSCSEGEIIEQSCDTKNGCGEMGQFRCCGMVTTLDIITFLAREDILLNPRAALKTPLRELFPSISQAVEHVHPGTSLCRALDIMLRGVQHLVMPIASSKGKEQGKQLNIHRPLVSTHLPFGYYCWITQEDIVRHLLSTCVGSFYPLPMMSLETLDIIDKNVITVDADSPAIRATQLLQRASQGQTAVAVVTSGSRKRGIWVKRSSGRVEGSRLPRLVGDLSTLTMRGCTEIATAAAALATLSIREFLQFVNAEAAGSPSHYLIQKVFNKLSQKALQKPKSSSSRSCPSLSFDPTWLAPDVSNLKSSDSFSDDDSSSSDEEESVRSFAGGDNMNLNFETPGVPHKDKTLITCTPKSSLVAIMVQAVAHRVNHVWVTDEDGGLVGIVTLKDMLRILISRLHSLGYRGYQNVTSI